MESPDRRNNVQERYDGRVGIEPLHSFNRNDSEEEDDDVDEDGEDFEDAVEEINNDYKSWDRRIMVDRLIENEDEWIEELLRKHGSAADILAAKKIGKNGKAGKSPVYPLATLQKKWKENGHHIPMSVQKRRAVGQKRSEIERGDENTWTKYLWTDWKDMFVRNINGLKGRVSFSSWCKDIKGDRQQNNMEYQKMPVRCFEQMFFYLPPGCIIRRRQRV